MDVRRAGAKPAPAAAPKARSAAPAPRAASTPSPAKPLGQNSVRDGFESARRAPVALAAPEVSAGFKRPSVSGEWTRTDKGQQADPVTFYVHGSLQQVEGALGQAGWTQADPKSLGANLRYAGAAVKQEAYKALSWLAKQADGIEVGLAGVFGLHPRPLFPTTTPYVPGVDKMPVSPQSYQGRPLVAAFERDNDPLGGRHHLRIFDTGQRDAAGQPVWAIAASRDSGIRFAPDHPECAFLFHTVESDVSRERDFVLQGLKGSGHVANSESFGLAYPGKSTYGEYVGDGRGYEVTLQ